MAEKKDTRRAVLTGGAVLLGAAVVGSQGTAEAANGSAVLAGRTTNAASAETRLTSSGNAPGLRLVTSSTGGGAIALYAAANGGYGAYVESTSNIGASIWTKHKDKYGVVAVNAAAKGSGGAVRADGRQNVGLFATTSHNDTSAITARNTAPSNGKFQERAIVATAGNGQNELAAWPLFLMPAIFASGHHGIVGIPDGQGNHIGAGVAGVARHPNTVGIFAQGASPAQALQATGSSSFFGDVYVGGTLSKSAGSFRIDHPLDPADKYLSHSFVESPDMMNVYNGNVVANADGEAEVELPDWFEALNKDFRYQLTPIGGSAPDLHVKAKVAEGRFTIAGAKAGQEISWQLTGIRQDAYANAHRIKVEEAKPAKEKGKYLFPKGFGKPQSAGVGPALRP